MYCHCRLPLLLLQRCFLALAEQMAKHMLMLKDASLYEIIAFLHAADLHGKDIKTDVGARVTLDPTAAAPVNNTVSFEARQLKRIFLKLC
jgi:tetratricopeptide repeat protein 30